MRLSCDVLVIGGGPAGAATAAHAARAGLSVVVAERARFPRDKACAEYLSPEATLDLAELGVLADLDAAGAERLRGFRLVSDDGRDVCGRYANTAFAGGREFGYSLPRARLDAILLDAARRAGAEVSENTTLERLEMNGRVTGAQLRDAAGRAVSVAARAVVGADGLNSRVARQLGLAHRGRPHRLALVAHLSGMDGMTDVGEMFAGRGWYVGIASIGNGLVNASMVVAQSEAPAIGKVKEPYFLAKLRTLPELERRLRSVRIARPVMVAGPFARRARSAVANGALLVGDAADFYDPFTGEGIFAALRGGKLAAATLADALSRGEADRSALLPYAAARRRAFFGKWVLERFVGLCAPRPRLMRRFTRRLQDRADIADLWVGAAGDIVPVRQLFTPRHFLPLVV